MSDRSQPIRVILIDDHLVVRAGLRMVIESHPAITVVAEATNRDEALEVVAAQQPDIILLDIDLSGESGVELIPELLARAPGMQVLVLTGVRDANLHRQAVLQGAMGVVLKDKAVETVIKAIERVHAGEVWLDRALMASVLRDRVRSNNTAGQDPEALKIAALTPREREVIALLSEGLKNRDIAQRLHISEATVRHHLTSVFDKLGVEDRFELVVYAFRHGLAPKL